MRLTGILNALVYLAEPFINLWLETRVERLKDPRVKGLTDDKRRGALQKELDRHVPG